MQINTNPAALFDAITAVTVAHPKTFGRLGVSRPIGFVVLGLAATGQLDELSKGQQEGSVADRIIRGDELKDIPAACVAVLGTGKSAPKFTTFALIGMHVAAEIGFGEATIAELGKVPGTSASKVQDFLSDLPTMAEYRKQIEARKKAAAKKAADTAAVRQVLDFAARFKVTATEEHFADAMNARELTWDQVQDLIKTLTAEADAKTEAEANADA
ncbi:hypothetical protein ACQP25_17065 [Microtetraspora malaysiensis]|uniref:hypothetical protein n=1 Tax=Microtetraspora malaysiensis TaxID=161358 RepID=UPI003D92E4AC